jgi:hypothetical protein
MQLKGTKLNVFKYLEEEPKARERKNKPRALANLLFRRFPELQELDKDKLEQIASFIVSSERSWRKILQEHPRLRGSDYEKSKKPSQKKVLDELGYSSN